MVFIRSFLFYSLFILSVPPTAVFLWVIPFISPFSSWQLCKYWDCYVNFLLKYICKINIEVNGSCPKPNDPCIFISNHTGPWETVGIMPYINQDLTFVLKKQLISWKYNFFALGIRAIKAIPISREANAGDLNIMKELTLKRMEENKSVIIFPGGTRKALKESIDYGVGGLILAKKVKCPVQILFVDSECWARGKYIKDYGFLYPGTMKLTFGPYLSKEKICDNKVKILQSEVLEFYNEQLKKLENK